MSARSLGAPSLDRAGSQFGAPLRARAQPLGAVVLNPAAKSRMDDEAFKAPQMPVPAAALPWLPAPAPSGARGRSLVPVEFGRSGRPLVPLRI
ncbi:MAG TPA: hypothetical protein VNZ54_01170 [bacterium]|jgi:hypothetical protein|nr:hypothetical protein [bacterium]HXC64436.1 hypothetical protein [bacterium]